jgi:uncharacterized membrane protein YidH (DUF202 family)
MEETRPQPDRPLDASRRTQLANERTYLAWLRSGLAALAVGLGVAKFLPDFAGGATWPYVVLGGGFCLLGLAMVGLGVRRLREVNRALAQGSYTAFREADALVLGLFAALLAILTMGLIVFDR